MQRTGHAGYLMTSSSADAKQYKELMNKDKTVIYTGEVIIPGKIDTDEDSVEGQKDSQPKTRTEYVASGQGKLEAKFY